MRLACVGYRKWALNIYDSLANSLDHNFFIIRSKEQFNAEAIFDFNPDLILFYGWSWLVDIKIINKFNCLMLHPSPLPKYRGGSPIQNQIISCRPRCGRLFKNVIARIFSRAVCAIKCQKLNYPSA